MSATLRLIGWICLAAAWLIPNKFPPWTSFHNEVPAFLALMALSVAGWRQMGRCRIPPVAWSILAVALVPWAQWAFGLLAFSGDAWLCTLYLAALSTAVATGHALAAADRQRIAAELSTAVLAAALVSSLLALLQFFRVVESSPWLLGIAPGARPGANLGQANNLASLIGMGMISLWLLYERGRLSAIAAAAVCLPLLLVLGITQSRTALVYGPIFLVALTLARRRGLALKLPSAVALTLVLGHWLATAGMATLQNAMLLEPLGTLGSRALTSPRWQMWPMLLDAASRSPWVGYGWLQIGAAELEVVNAYPAIDELWLHGHNLFVELIVWCGYPLGLLLGAACVYWFWSRARWVATLEGVTGMVIIALLGAHSLMEFPYHYAFFLVPAGLWIGLVETTVQSKLLATSRFFRFVPLGLTVAIAVGVAKDYPAVEEDFRLVRFQILRIGDVDAADSTPDAPFISNLTSFLHFSRTLPTRGMSEAQLKSMEASARRYPFAASLSRYGVALALNGHMNEARECFISVRRMFGDGTYLKLRRGLREQVIDGQPEELAKLEHSLPN